MKTPFPLPYPCIRQGKLVPFNEDHPTIPQQLMAKYRKAEAKAITPNPMGISKPKKL